LEQIRCLQRWVLAVRDSIPSRDPAPLASAGGVFCAFRAASFPRSLFGSMGRRGGIIRLRGGSSGCLRGKGRLKCFQGMRRGRRRRDYANGMGKPRRALVFGCGRSRQAMASMAHTRSHSGCAVAAIPRSVTGSVPAAVAIATTITVSTTISTAVASSRRMGRRYERVWHQHRCRTGQQGDDGTRYDELISAFHGDGFPRL
jgi:hypothetical protein